MAAEPGDAARQHLARHELHHLLRQVHHVVEVRVRQIELELGELGVVLEAHALVAEVAADLVHALVHADQQPLQVQLERDAQVQVLVELVVVGDERPGRRSAVERLKDGRLDFQESLVVEEFAQGFDDPGPHAEDVPHLWIHRQVGVALAVARFGVAECAMPLARPVGQLLFLGDGQRTDRLTEQFPRADAQGRLAALGDEQAAFGLDEIAQVEVFETLERCGVDRIGADAGIELDPPAAVLDRGEAGLAHDALGDDASHQRADGGIAVVQGCRLLLVAARRQRVAPGQDAAGSLVGHQAEGTELGAGRVRVDAGGFQLLKLGQAVAFNFGVFHAEIRNWERWTQRSQSRLNDRYPAMFLQPRPPVTSLDSTGVVAACAPGSHPVRSVCARCGWAAGRRTARGACVGRAGRRLPSG